MDYAVISLSNNQYLVKSGSKISILGELGKPGDKLTAKALLLKGDQVEIGTPTLETPITLKVVDITKTEKVDVLIYKAKSRYRKHRGHRQMQTILEVVGLEKEVSAVKKAPVTKKTSTTKKAPTAKKTAAKKTAAK